MNYVDERETDQRFRTITVVSATHAAKTKIESARQALNDWAGHSRSDLYVSAQNGARRVFARAVADDEEQIFKVLRPTPAQ